MASSWRQGLKKLNQRLTRNRSEITDTESQTVPISSLVDVENSILPPKPRDILANRVLNEYRILDRKLDRFIDTLLATLYRIYEYIMLDQSLNIRNAFEYFWYRNTWALEDIPDPQDEDPERYACLACIPAMLCLAFNERIKLGLPRNAPPIITQDLIDKWSNEEKKFEKEPSWAEAVPKLTTFLAIPHWDNKLRDFVPLDGFDSEKASKEFAKKNILIWQPHIYFM